MARIRCFTGLLSVGAPPIDYPSVRGVLRQSSGGTVDMMFDHSKQQALAGFGGPRVWSLQLHAATRRLTGNPLQALRVERVALLFAGKYAPFERAFGVMFDRGFRTDDDPGGGSDLNGVPREGCAVFLDAIAQRRPADAIDKETLFTTIHELGHLFNLLHSARDKSYMSRSGPRVHGDEYFRFTDGQGVWLQGCDDSRSVSPGGLPFLGFDDDGGFLDGGVSRGRRSGLRLKTHLCREWTTPAEPLELDVELSLSSRARRGRRVPHEIDPGYGRFRLWIERPDGERRLYRSPRHYCSTGARISLRPGESFERDVSVFGQSGGYTFDMPGLYRIWAEFDVSENEKLRSKAVEVEVRLPGADSRILRRADVARLLYYRELRGHEKAAKDLRRFVRDEAKGAAAGLVAYALGRATLREARNGEHRSKAMEQRAHDLLRRAVDDETVGKNARAKATSLLAE